MKTINLILCMMLLFVLTSLSLVKADEKDVTVKGKVVKAIVQEETGKVFVLLPGRMFSSLNDSLETNKKVSVVGPKVSTDGHECVKVEKVELN